MIYYNTRLPFAFASFITAVMPYFEMVLMDFVYNFKVTNLSSSVM